MAKEATPSTRTARGNKNGNLGTFVDAVTPEPKIVTENYLQLHLLGNKSESPETNEWIRQCIDIVLSIREPEGKWSYGETVAVNTLRKRQILM